MANHGEDQSAEQQAFKVPEIKFTNLFINGEFLDSVSGKRFETRDPRNGEVAAIVAEGDKEDVDLAVTAARQAFKYGPWPRMSGYQRGRILMKFADLVEEHAVEIASLEALNAGKVVAMTAGFEIPLAVSIARYYGGAADKIHGETLKMGGEIPIQGYTLREPIGVVAHIIPWNFPTLLFLVKTTAAFAAGCTMVVKPAEQTPLSALYLAHLAKLAGIPDGVINVVTGYGHTAGAALASHMDVDKISFTGSTEVGRLILQASAASNLKEVSLELGGKCPMIICDDADLDKAVDLAFTGSFINKGEMCIASSRVFVQESIHDQIVEKLVEKTKSWVVGDPFNPKVQQGPQVDKKQFEKIMSYIDHGKREGATLVTGGKRCGDNKGHYVEPTIFTDVKDDMLIARDEIFGPVVAVMKFKTIEEVIERANDTNYGLAAMLVTNNLNVANTVSRSLHAGMVWINCYLAIGADAPFGGFKMSGLGKDLGMDGLYKYTQLKTVVTPIYNSPWL